MLIELSVKKKIATKQCVCVCDMCLCMCVLKECVIGVHNTVFGASSQNDCFQTKQVSLQYF